MSVALETICLNPATGRRDRPGSPARGRRTCWPRRPKPPARAQPAWAATPGQVSGPGPSSRGARLSGGPRRRAGRHHRRRTTARPAPTPCSAEVLPATVAAHYYAKKAASWLKRRPEAPARPCGCWPTSAPAWWRQPWGGGGHHQPLELSLSPFPFPRWSAASWRATACCFKVASETQMVGQALSPLHGGGRAAARGLHLPEPAGAPGRVRLSWPLGWTSCSYTGSVGVGKQLMGPGRRPA